ncbi:hypothetical protein BCT93_22485 [Vibrio lentus]|uniref:hypothetical protein n=1 Tax=Vibrio TaxID=662 RepID=UPI000C84FCA2|nr:MULTISPECIES: hypothetical protein [Vibrio]MCG9692880.1 hypothetical protein [Vibrio sp. Isolate22]PMK67014.1 hypothetical protein BCT93_22485 [Vibrio lentus]
MLAFLKKWRQAYRDEKGDRLHAEVEAERNVLCREAVDCASASRIFKSTYKSKKTIDFNKMQDDAMREFPYCEEQRNMW